MANVIIEEQTLKDIADSIRAKSGKIDKMLPRAMSEEITNLPSGGGSIQNGVEYLELDSSMDIIKAKVYGNSVPNNAFYNCSKLTLTELPSDLTHIGNNAFRSCSNLALTELPSGLTRIGVYAFYGCNNLALTELPTGVTSIDAYTFYGCTKLALTELHADVTSIGSSAFQSCTGLTELTFKGTPTSIHSLAFTSCTNLKTINVPWAEGEVANAPWGATNATINYNHGQYGKAFTIRFLNGNEVLQSSEVLYGEMPVYNGEEPTKNGYTFDGWTPELSVVTGDMDYVATFKSSKSQTRALVDRSITEVSNEYVTKISACTFYNCTNLASVYLPNVTSILDEAFRYCSNLKSVDLPKVTEIGSSNGRLFLNCPLLDTLILRSDTICKVIAWNNQLIDENSPIGKGTGYIYVPKSLLSDEDATMDYRRANVWSKHATQFRAIEDYPEICGGV